MNFSFYCLLVNARANARVSARTSTCISAKLLLGYLLVLVVVVACFTPPVSAAAVKPTPLPKVASSKPTATVANGNLTVQDVTPRDASKALPEEEEPKKRPTYQEPASTPSPTSSFIEAEEVAPASQEEGEDDSEAAEAKKVTVDITSKELQYDQALKAYVATGTVHVVVSEQNSTLDADKITYDQDHDVMVAEGNVRIERNGQVTLGSLARVDLTRESALINDASTQVQMVRIKAPTAYVDSNLLRMENGRFILDRTEFLAGLKNSPRVGPVGQKPLATKADLSTQFLSGLKGQTPSAPNGSNSNPNKVLRNGYFPHLLTSPGARYFVDKDFVDSQAAQGGGAQGEFLSFYASGKDAIALDTSELAGNEQQKSNFATRIQHIDVQQYPDNYNEVTLKWPKVTYRNIPVFTYPAIDIGFDKDKGRFDYLGPDFGYNRDYGGFYAGPGFDFKAGPGVFKFSPLLTYGNKIDRDGGNFQQKGNQFGVGINAQYRDDSNRLEFARSSNVNYNVFYGEHRFFRDSNIPFLRAGATRLVASNNYSVGGNLINGVERPQASLQLTDNRILYANKAFSVLSNASVGLFKDEFNPNNSNVVFINRTSATPQTEGRLLGQLLVANNKPLAQVGDFLDFGYLGQLSGAAYSTGDHLAVARFGPTATLRVKDRFMSQAYYAMAAQSGDSPFVFDGYFLGKQALTLNNALRLNKNVLVGARNDFSLLRDNAENTALVGNVLYATVGPPDLKFTIGFDFIRKMSYFGLNFYPSAGFTTIDFDSANVYQAKSADPANTWTPKEKAKRERLLKKQEKNKPSAAGAVPIEAATDASSGVNPFNVAPPAEEAEMMLMQPLQPLKPLDEFNPATEGSMPQDNAFTPLLPVSTPAAQHKNTLSVLTPFQDEFVSDFKR